MSSRSVKDKEKCTELKALLAVLRALVTSRKQPCFLEDILRDYRDLENQSIPFQRFQFNNVEELLIDSDEFLIKKNFGKTFVAAKQNDKSKHIAQLVRGQKRSKGTSRIVTTPLKRFQRRPGNQHSRPSPPQNLNVNATKCGLTPQQQTNFLLNQKYELQSILEKQYKEKFEKEKAKLKEQLLNEFETLNKTPRNDIIEHEKCYNDLVNQNDKLYEELKDLKNRLNELQLNRTEYSNNLHTDYFDDDSVQKSPTNDLVDANEKFFDELKEMRNRLIQLNLNASCNQNLNNTNDMSATPEKEQQEVQTKKSGPQQQNAEVKQKLENEKSKKGSSQQHKEKQFSPIKKKPQQQPQQYQQQSDAASVKKHQSHVTSPNSKQPRGQNPQSPRSVVTPTNNKKDVNNKPAITDLRQRLNALHMQNEKQQQQQNPTKRYVPATLAIVPATDSMPPKHHNHRSGNPSLRPILGQNNNPRNHPQSQQHQAGVNNRQNTKNNSNNNKVPQNTIQQNYPTNLPISPQQQQPVQKILPKLQQSHHQQRQFPIGPSVQNRLKLQINNSNRNGVNGNSKSPTISPPIVDYQKSSFKSNVPQENLSNAPNKIYRFDPNIDPCTAIAKYCAARGYEMPKYSVMRSKEGTFDCKLELNSNTIYSTYPLEYPTQELARQNCAAKAIQQIQIVEARNLLPTYPNDKEFLDVLYKELLQHPHGMISDKMTDWFVEKFAYRMPEYWFLLVKNSRRFTVEDGIKDGTFIILANSGITIDDDIPLEALVATTAIQMEPLKLPWSEKYWDLYITHCVSTVEIWAYLVGPEYNARFAALMTELDLHMLTKKTRPDVIAPKHIYLVEVRPNWHRVRVESLDLENEMALCFYIDFGDRERVPMNELYLCDPQFLRLPPQAVPFSLFGLEDFACNPNALSELEKNLLHRSVIADVITKEADFEANSNIQIIIFDTSTDEDINLNVVLQDEICRVATMPKLKEKGMTPVSITNVDNATGDVSVQVINAESEYVQRIIKQILQDKFQREQHKCSLKELTRPQMLLVHDNECGDGTPQWYRAKVIDIQKISNLEKQQERMLEVLYIDYNTIRPVHVDNIYRLESLSLALSKFPSQALRIKLHNIPEYSPNIIGRMRALLPENCQAFVRIEVNGDIPQVTILRRVNGPDMPYCSINDDLRMEIERSKDAALCTNNAGEASVVGTSSDALASPTELFRSLTLGPAAMMPLKISELPKLREYDNIPALNSIFYVHVSMVSNPQSFTVQPYNEDFGRFQNLMRELQDYCANNEAYIPVDMVEMGQAYAAANVDCFYRVIAKARYGEMIEVFYCDYGDNRTIRSDQLKVLPLKFRQLPQMSINARLFGIKAHKDEVWSNEDVQRFRDLVLGMKLASFVKGIERDDKGRSELTLDLVDVSKDEDINIRDVLLYEGLVKQ